MRDGAIRDRLWRDISVRVGGGLVVAAVLAGSWWELLFLPLGASHDGRINGRFGLHVRNFLEHGLVNSDYLASVEPFSDVPYTHHPPLLNVLHALTGSIFGQGEWQLHAIGYLAGLATVGGLLWMARELDLGPWSSIAAMALVASTPMFWIYGRLGLGVSIMVVLMALWTRHRRVGGRQSLLVATAALTAFSSWMGAALAVLMPAPGLRDARCRSTALKVGVAGLVAAVVAVAWAAGAGDMGELVDHAAARRRLPGWATIVQNHRWFYGTLFPSWTRWMILPAIVLALGNAKTRPAAGATLASLAIWTLVVPGAAHIHDYWTYPLLVPVFLGLTVLLDQGLSLSKRRWVVKGGLVAVVLVAAVGFTRLPAYRDAYFRAPSDAGALVREFAPPPGQATAWVVDSVDPVPHWVSYYWNLPVGAVTGGNLGIVGDTDIVLIRLDRVPSWMADFDVVATRGVYALVKSLQSQVSA